MVRIRYHGARPSACNDTSATEMRILGRDPEFNRQLAELVARWRTKAGYVNMREGATLDECADELEAVSGVGRR